MTSIAFGNCFMNLRSSKVVKSKNLYLHIRELDEFLHRYAKEHTKGRESTAPTMVTDIHRATRAPVP